MRLSVYSFRPALRSRTRDICLSISGWSIFLMNCPCNGLSLLLSILALIIFVLWCWIETLLVVPIFAHMDNVLFGLFWHEYFVILFYAQPIFIVFQISPKYSNIQLICSLYCNEYASMVCVVQSVNVSLEAMNFAGRQIFPSFIVYTLYFWIKPVHNSECVS